MTDHMKLLSDRDRKLNTVDLKPCPFCGGRAIQRYENSIYCEEVTFCGCEINYGHWIGGNDEESIQCRKAVAESWNRRKDNVQ